MTEVPQVAPVLSTPDTHIFEAPAPTTAPRPTIPEEELDTKYEIPRTIREIKNKRWKRIALQFPDDLLPDAPRVFERLREGLKKASPEPLSPSAEISKLKIKEDQGHDQPQDFTPPSQDDADIPETLSILGDTSYGSCCVDEVAAQHVSADAVIHYGRACLSPTSHLPALHIFTINALPLDPVVAAFTSTYPDKSAPIILTSDVTYSAHLPALSSLLHSHGYTTLFTTTIIHSPTSPIPNRTTPSSPLTSHSLFHIGHPPQSLLLTLASRLSTIHIYPSTPLSPTPTAPLLASTALALRRRYALLTRLSRAPIIGILINTLSVHAYLAALESIQKRITQAGKKYYVFVVGKLNAAKIANFAEVGGWVVVGCWESSLVESGEFEKPVVVPWELELALRGDGERVWTGEWRGDFGGVLEGEGESGERSGERVDEGEADDTAAGDAADGGDLDEEESEPPEFDLRTGRYIQHSRPMRQKTAVVDRGSTGATNGNGNRPESSLIKRAKGDLARIGGEVSPGAEFLREKRTWRGLGSDFEIAYDNEDEGAAVKEGRSGIARGYQNEQDKT